LENSGSGVDSELGEELKIAREKIDVLESYNRLNNLIIAGLPLVNCAQAMMGS